VLLFVVFLTDTRLFFSNPDVHHPTATPEAASPDHILRSPQRILQVFADFNSTE
jgi:hypothetical protein